MSQGSRRRFLSIAPAASAFALFGGGGLALAAGTGKRATAVVRGALPDVVVPPLGVRVLSRMGFGHAVRSADDPSSNLVFKSSFETGEEGTIIDDVSYFNSLGSNDEARLQAWVDEQLNPDLADFDLQARIAAYPNAFSTLDEPLAITFNTRECNGFSEYSRPLKEVERAAFTRAVHSKRQLFEYTADFWHNHLNVFGGEDEDTYVSWASWDRDVIRQHAFGNFYQMLIASARHPAMMHYLDNYTNRTGGVNENYARELFELHTLGAINYLGVQPQASVEALPENPYTALNDPELNSPALGYIADPSRQIGRYFVDDDVYSAAEALTGWRYSDENVGDDCGTGAFMTDESEHSSNIPKACLSRGFVNIPSDLQAAVEGRLIVKMVAYHPATADHIARKLCKRLIGPQPPQSVVDEAAQTFFANRLASDQIARTLRTIVLSDAFSNPANWGTKVRRPFDYVVAGIRATGTDYTFREDDDTSHDLVNTFNRANQRLFWWRAPNGYPDENNHWLGTTSLVQSWRTIDWLVDRDAGDDDDRVMRIIDRTLNHFPGDPSPRDLVEFWGRRILGFTPPEGWSGPVGTLFNEAPTTVGRAALQFMTQQGFSGAADKNPWPADEGIDRNELDNNGSGFDWHKRLRGLVDVFIWSPQFMLR